MKPNPRVLIGEHKAASRAPQRHFPKKSRGGRQNAPTSRYPLDAAHALTLGLTLVTNKVREFRRVPQLSIENGAETT